MKEKPQVHHQDAEEEAEEGGETAGREEDMGEDEEEDGEVGEQILEELKHFHCQTVFIGWTICGLWILYLLRLFHIFSYFASNPTRSRRYGQLRGPPSSSRGGDRPQT